MSFFTVIKNEAKRIFKDPAIVLTIIGGVILYSFLYPQPYAKQSVSELHVSVVDLDKSDLSREIIFKLDATPQINIVRRDLSEQNAKDALLQSKVRAVIVIPRDFKRDIALNKSPTIAVGADSSYFLIYGSVLEGAMKSVLTQSAMIKVANLLKEQVPLIQAEHAYAPYTLDTINLFNINNSYTQYVIPAVFVLILQQIILIGLGILGGGVNEAMKKGEEGYFKDAAIWQMYLSRIIIFGLLFFIHMLFYFGYSFEHLGVTRMAEIYDIITLGVPFLLASIALGLFLGSLFSSREIATPAILFTSLPLIFSAGFIWPLESLPGYMYLLSLLAPCTAAIHGFLGINQMGADFSMIINDYMILWIQTIVYLTLAGFIFKRRRENAYKQHR